MNTFSGINGLTSYETQRRSLRRVNRFEFQQMPKDKTIIVVQLGNDSNHTFGERRGGGFWRLQRSWEAEPFLKLRPFAYLLPRQSTFCGTFQKASRFHPAILQPVSWPFWQQYRIFRQHNVWKKDVWKLPKTDSNFKITTTNLVTSLRLPSELAAMT